MRRTAIFTTIVISLISIILYAGNPESKSKNSNANEFVVSLTNEAFRKNVFDYVVNKEWKYAGSKPAIIDFYADWCPPCRQLSPLVEEIAKEYEGKIVVYKVNTDKERALAQSLGIESLPTLLFIPAKGKPQISQGYVPKETIVKAINEVLLTK
jgi:thioredoxin 1